MLHNHGTFVKTQKLTLVQSSLDIRWGLVPGGPVDTQIRGCSSSLYEMQGTVGPLYPRVQHPRIQRADCTLIEFHQFSTRILFLFWNPIQDPLFAVV